MDTPQVQELETTQPQAKVRKRSRQSENTWSGYLFILPMLVIFSVFTVFPVLYSLYISFHDWPLMTSAADPHTFVGIDNYRRILVDPDFHKSFFNTIYYVLGSVPTGLAISLGLAMLLNCGLKGVSWYRTSFFTPVVTAGVAVGLLWRWVFNGEYGLLNYGLEMIHLPTQDWLNEPNHAMLTIIIASIWKGVGFSMVIFLAGLQGIPEHLYEAARLDGASAWRQFRHITLPLLSPTIFFVTVMSIIGSFQVFDMVYVMTGGGPLHATDVVIFYLFQYAFQRFQLGYAAAISYILFAVIFVLTLAQLRIFGRRVQYEM